MAGFFIFYTVVYTRTARGTRFSASYFSCRSHTSANSDLSFAKQLSRRCLQRTRVCMYICIYNLRGKLYDGSIVQDGNPMYIPLMHDGSVREMDPRGYKLPWRRNFLHVYDYRGYSLTLNEIEEQREGTSRL